jgi:ferritin
MSKRDKVYELTYFNITGQHIVLGTIEELQGVIRRLDDCDILYFLNKFIDEEEGEDERD